MTTVGSEATEEAVKKPPLCGEAAKTGEAMQEVLSGWTDHLELQNNDQSSSSDDDDDHEALSRSITNPPTPNRLLNHRLSSHSPLFSSPTQPYKQRSEGLLNKIPFDIHVTVVDDATNTLNRNNSKARNRNRCISSDNSSSNNQTNDFSRHIYRNNNNSPSAVNPFANDAECYQVGKENNVMDGIDSTSKKNKIKNKNDDKNTFSSNNDNKSNLSCNNDNKNNFSNNNDNGNNFSSHNYHKKAKNNYFIESAKGDFSCLDDSNNAKNTAIKDRGDLGNDVLLSNLNTGNLNHHQSPTSNKNFNIISPNNKTGNDNTATTHASSQLDVRTIEPLKTTTPTAYDLLTTDFSSHDPAVPITQRSSYFQNINILPTIASRNDFFQMAEISDETGHESHMNSKNNNNE